MTAGMRRGVSGGVTGLAFVVFATLVPACESQPPTADAAPAVDTFVPDDDSKEWGWDAGFVTDLGTPSDRGPALLDTGVDASDASTDVPAVDVAAVACSVVAPTMCPTPVPHYADVSPIFQARCVGPCHNGATLTGPWPLVGYEHVSDWQDGIRDQLINCTMPPTDAGVPITTEEREAILVWIRCGLPR